MNLMIISRRLPLIFLLGGILLLLAAGCGGDGDASPTPSPDVTSETPVDGDTSPTPSPELTPETPAPTATEGVAGGLPEDFPLYPGASMGESVRFGSQLLVNFETDDPREDVFVFFRDALAKAPWEVQKTEDLPERGTTTIRFAHLEEPIDGIVTLVSSDESTLANVRFTLPGTVPEPGSSATPGNGEG